MGKQLVGMIGDRALCERAVRNAVNRNTRPRPRWAVVRETFACGSTVAKALCERFKLDPDEELPAAPAAEPDA